MATQLLSPPRTRIGQVSVYFHHGKVCVYYRRDGEPVRQAIGTSMPEAEAVASLINARLTAEAARLARGNTYLTGSIDATISEAEVRALAGGTDPISIDTFANN